jgi:hypothetical protein
MLAFFVKFNLSHKKCNDTLPKPLFIPCINAPILQASSDYLSIGTICTQAHALIDDLWALFAESDVNGKILMTAHVANINLDGLYLNFQIALSRSTDKS